MAISQYVIRMYHKSVKPHFTSAFILFSPLPLLALQGASSIAKTWSKECAPFLRLCSLLPNDWEGRTPYLGTHGVTAPQYVFARYSEADLHRPPSEDCRGVLVRLKVQVGL